MGGGKQNVEARLAEEEGTGKTKGVRRRRGTTKNMVAM